MTSSIIMIRGVMLAAVTYQASGSTKKTFLFFQAVFSRSNGFSMLSTLRTDRRSITYEVCRGIRKALE